MERAAHDRIVPDRQTQVVARVGIAGRDPQSPNPRGNGSAALLQLVVGVAEVVEQVRVPRPLSQRALETPGRLGVLPAPVGRDPFPEEERGFVLADGALRGRRGGAGG